jgi:primase-polymerase (primpol)-like protein
MPRGVSDIEGLPDALMARDQWVCWRREGRDGKVTKVPVEPATGGYASTTDPDTWTGIERAFEAVDETNADGVGFVFTDDDPLVGVDLDDCRDTDSGSIDEWARDVVTRLDSYAEVSPSGTGVHVIVEGKLPDGRSRSGDVEMYETSRFFTVTGDHLDQTPTAVRRRVDAIRGVHADYVQPSTDADGGDDASPQDAKADVDFGDEELHERARAAANGDRFAALWRGETGGYDSHSEADMALCLHLAFWTGGDASRVDGLFRRSGLMRSKWDEVHYADGATYGERTIERSLEMVDEVYEPEGELDGGDAGTQPSRTTDGSDSRKQEPPAASARRDESVYLEERNRLLREKVQSQAATIERQGDRIEELENDLERTTEQLAIQDTLRGDRSGDGDNLSRFWGWIRDR